jgi:dTDP-4-dehydrorhamnose 3,5-epimerase
MIFKQCLLQGAHLITLEAAVDERGSFARTFCRNEFKARGLVTEYVQNSISENSHRGTLRGLHYQDAPAAEVKLIQCVRGSVYDVIVDLRPESQTYCHWEHYTLSAENRQLLYIPEGLAHGFMTLKDDTALYYMISEYYEPGLARGVRFDDPVFGIKWPSGVKIIAEKDRFWPDYRR